MRRFSRSVLLPLVLILAAVPATARDRWIRIDVPGARVFSDGDPARARHVARTVEALRAFLEKTSPELLAGAAAPFDVVLLGDPGRLAAELGETHGILGRATALGAVLAVDADASLPGILAELVVHRARSAGPQLPAWYRRGLGDFFAAFTVDRDGYAAGAAPWGYRRVLASQGAVPLVALLESGPRGEADSSMRPTAWAFVHFLTTVATPAERSALLAALGEGLNPDAASRRAFGIPIADLEARFRETTGRYELPAVRVPRDAVSPAEPAASVPVEKKGAVEARDRIAAAIVAERAASSTPFPDLPRTPIAVATSPALPASRAPERVIAPEAPTGVWLHLATPHFRVWSEAGPAVTRDVAVRLETMLAVVNQVSGGLGDLGDPLDVWVFASTESMTLASEGKASNNGPGGLFMRRGNRRALLVLGDAVTRLRTRIVYHELAHYLTAERCTRCPGWFSEGFAEYYSTMSVSNGVAEIGQEIYAHVAILLEYGSPNVAELLRQRDLPRHGLTDEQTHLFYARSWALVHFLLSSGRVGRDGLDRLIAASVAGDPPEVAVRNAFGSGPEELDRVIDARLRGSATLKPVRVPLDGALVPEIGEPEPAKIAALKTRLGEIAYLGFPDDRREAGLEPFRAAIAADPSYAPAHAGLAAALGELDRHAEATASWNRALELAPDDVGIARDAGAYFAGLLFDEPRLEDAEAKATIARARALLERALAARPTDRVALYAYGSLVIADEQADPGPGIAALEAVVAGYPFDPEPRFSLLLLLVRRGDREKAESTLEAYRAVETDAKDLEKAYDLVLRLDLQDARKAAERGDREAAEAILRGALERAKTDPMRRRIEAALAEIEESKRKPAPAASPAR